MKGVHLFSDDPQVVKAFNKLKRAKDVDLTVKPTADYRTAVKALDRGQFVYLDLSSLNERERVKAFNQLDGNGSIEFGIVDPKGAVKDPAALFHSGASDYLGPSLLENPIPAKRFRAALDYLVYEDVDEEVLPEPEGNLGVGLGWDEIRPGREYPFAFLYIDIDINPDWAAKSGKDHLARVMDLFYRHLEKVVSPLQGRLWIKTDRGGLVLFPHGGSCTPVILECFRLVLNRLIISAEEYPFESVVSYSMILDTGTTLYQERGDTGNVISASVNYVFHLAKQKLTPGQFLLTERIRDDVPAGLNELFLPDGQFQGLGVFRMRRPVFQ